MEVRIDSVQRLPYAAPANLDHLLTLHRAGKLPECLTSQELLDLGIAEGNLSRTRQALAFFGFVDEKERLTPRFTSLALADEKDYPSLLSTILRETYHEIFALIGDPSVATEEQLVRAFQHFYPSTQYKRMIALFKHLCRQAGLMKSASLTVHRRKRVHALLLKQLPVDNRWTEERRERWLQAVTANVDLLIEVEGGNISP